MALRADASVEIGTGHVMRCLTLADALAAAGAECHVICRDLPGNLAAQVRERGHTCHLLPAPDTREDDSATAHSSWLGVTRAQDAQDCYPILADLCPDWLIVDHYALDAGWETAMRSVVGKVMVIDDLADRQHDCDLLLDQNLGRASQDYDGLLPEPCDRLIGPRYAILRPEFAKLRANSLARREHHPLKRVLVTMGGVDKGNATERVLNALDAASLPNDVRITVVMGPKAPWLNQVRVRADRMRLTTEVKVAVCDMARMMAESDLAIGAGGTTAWERCALGLPSITLVLAKNQEVVAEMLQRAGAALSCRNVNELVGILNSEVFQDDLIGALARMSRHAAAVTDGKGATRVVQQLALLDD